MHFKMDKDIYSQPRAGEQLSLDHLLKRISNLLDNGSRGRSCHSQCSSATLHQKQKSTDITLQSYKDGITKSTSTTSNKCNKLDDDKLSSSFRPRGSTVLRV